MNDEVVLASLRYASQSEVVEGMLGTLLFASLLPSFFLRLTSLQLRFRALLPMQDGRVRFSRKALANSRSSRERGRRARMYVGIIAGCGFEGQIVVAAPNMLLSR